MQSTEFLGRILRPHSPTVLYTCNKWINTEYNSPLNLILEGLKYQRVILLVGIWWTVEPDIGNPGRLCNWINCLSREFKNLKVLVCANTIIELETLNSAGAEAILANQNAFLDERIFHPLDDVCVEFDAIYNAQFLPFKRHELLEEAEGVALIGYNHEADQQYLKKIARILNKSHILNYMPDGRRRFLTPAECNQYYNSSGVGLCLSAKEGAMYASMEYLMSGLFVVSTASSGGRDFFFDDDVALIVDDSPGEIAEAINHVNAKTYSRAQVAESVLEKVFRERRKFISAIDQLISQESNEKYFIKENWDQIFVNKLLEKSRTNEVIDVCRVCN